MRFAIVSLFYSVQNLINGNCIETSFFRPLANDNTFFSEVLLYLLSVHLLPFLKSAQKSIFKLT
nr:MAG TPA: hypothetical protein [Caudoviricetes sp.]